MRLYSGARLLLELLCLLRTEVFAQSQLQSSTSTIASAPLIITGSATRPARAGSSSSLPEGVSSEDGVLVSNGTLFLSAAPTVVSNSTGLESSTTTEPASPTNTQPCNLHIEFCTRKYGNITYVGTHNSPFAKPKNSASNQELTVEQQLTDGIRMLQGQTHVNNSRVYFCHTSCDILNAGPAVDYFRNVYNWLVANPFEVVTILIGNGAFADIKEFKAPLEESGLAKLAYKPPKAVLNVTEFPTLGEMIISGQRVVIFIDYKANFEEVPYIIDEFGGTMWETKMSQTDPNFPCNVDRPERGQAEPANHLMLANHNLNVPISLSGVNLELPNTVDINRTNAVEGFGSLGKQVDDCVVLWGRAPNFLLVDFYNAGNGSVFEVAAKANNVTYAGGCCGKKKSGAVQTNPNKASYCSLFAAIAVTVLFYAW